MILETLCSNLNINFLEFVKYYQETSELYVALNSFNPMSSVLQRVLCHGSNEIKEGILPIDLLLEEAAETPNKHIRSNRLNHTRGVSCKVDVLNRLLLTSRSCNNGYEKRLT